MNLAGYFKSLFNRRAPVAAQPEFAPGFNIRRFSDQLDITKLYCDTQLKTNPGKSTALLKSINPIYNNKNSFEIIHTSYPQTRWQIDPVDDNEFITHIFNEQLVLKAQIINRFEGVNDIKGKILIANVDETVTDGASEDYSEGFVDIFDIPPIDTWIYLAKKPNGLRRIYSWVPEQFIDLAEKAIAINCVDCLSWYDGPSFRS